MKSNHTLFLLLALMAAQVAGAATFTVTSTADSGPSSLRAALASAASGDTIDATGVSGTILLTSGELLVTNNLTIIGSGPGNLAVDGNAASRVFHVGSNTVVSISSLTIANGGGIWNDHATLTVSNCILIGNSSSLNSDNRVSGGGCIYNDGAGLGLPGFGTSGGASLVIVNSTLTGNFGFEGGAIFNDGYNNKFSGQTSVEIVNSTLSNNAAGNYYGGGIYNDSFFGTASVEIINSTLSGNSAGAGGGIYNDGEAEGSASLSVINTTLTGNSAIYGGGIFNETFEGSASVEIVGSTLNGNSASADGGGILN